MEFTELYKRISPKLKAIAYNYASRCGMAIDKDDLYQEMSEYLWDKFKDGVPAGLNDSYIVKGCQFYLLNYIRTHRENVFKLSLDEPINDSQDTLKDILPDAQETVPEYVNRKVFIDYVMNNGFTRREKDVFSLLIKGYTTREAGDELGISHVMVTKLKNRLFGKLHKEGYHN